MCIFNYQKKRRKKETSSRFSQTKIGNKLLIKLLIISLKKKRIQLILLNSLNGHLNYRYFYLGILEI